MTKTPVVKVAAAGLALLINSDLGREVVPVESAQDASGKYRSFVEAGNLGASEVDFGKVVELPTKALVATISYNGRVTLEAR